MAVEGDLTISQNDDALKQHLLSYFKKRAEQKDRDNFEQDKDVFLFHMRDCADDLPRLAALYERPESFGEKEAHAAL